ncbi:MAG: SRPBCC domain-containing protein [Verrucomicrobiae bacterium]|nr:SRPBCC domain-containing protein [Verrucomicrobiae bacterium]
MKPVQLNSRTRRDSRRSVSGWLATLAVIPVLTGCQHTYTEVDIEAPLPTVWQILVDTEAYPDWNPYHVAVKGELSVGRKLEVIIHKPNGSQLTIHPRVLRLKPGEELTWGGGVTGVFKGVHQFRLEALNGDTTRLIQEETFSGLAVPFAELDSIEEGYHQVNHAIKKRAETCERKSR